MGLILFPGDAILVRGTERVSRMIRVFTREPGEALTKYNHGEFVTVGGISFGARITEAVGVGIREIGFEEKHGKGPWPDIAVYRMRFVPGQKLVKLVEEARREIGDGYSFGSLSLLWADWVLGQVVRRRVTFLSRLGRVTPLWFCTEYLAMLYRKLGEDFGRPSAAVTTPDDIGDWVESHSDQWKCVLSLGTKEVG